MELKEYLEGVDAVCSCQFSTKEAGRLELHLYTPLKKRNRSGWILVLNGHFICNFKVMEAVLLREFILCIEKLNNPILSKNDILSNVRTATDKTYAVYSSEIKDNLEHTLASIVDTLIQFSCGRKLPIALNQVSDLYFSEAMNIPFSITLEMNRESDLREFNKYIEIIRRENIPQVIFKTTECINDRTFCFLIENAGWFNSVLETKGSLLTNQVCQDLYASSLDAVMVPLSSMDYGTEFHISECSPKDTLQGIKNAIKNHIDVIVQIKVTEENKNLSGHIKALHKIGVRRYRVAFDDLVTEKEVILKRAYFYTNINELELTLESFGVVPAKQLRRMKINRPIIPDCLISMCLKNDGNLYPHYTSKESLGSLIHSSLDEIWNGKRTKEIRKDSLRRSTNEKQYKG